MHLWKRLGREAGVSIYATWHSREAANWSPRQILACGQAVKSLVVTGRKMCAKWHPARHGSGQAAGWGRILIPAHQCAIRSSRKSWAESDHVTSFRIADPGRNCETTDCSEHGHLRIHMVRKSSAEIDFRKEGRPILEHCHENRSGQSCVCLKARATLDD